MNLNDTKEFAAIDKQEMLAHIDGLPGQLEAAWKLGLSLPLPQMNDIRRVVICGMGGSAIGADLLASYLYDKVEVPIIVHRDYGLPAFARERETLVVLSSHSGNTEETLSAFDEACRRNCQVVGITTGGKLKSLLKNAGMPVWEFQHLGQPRAAVGFSFGLLLALFTRLGLISDPTSELEDAVSAMKELAGSVNADVAVKNNPAKRLAGQMVGRTVTIFASGFMVTVARRWKCQINEVAKAEANFEFLPEADHNTLAGIYHPESPIAQEIRIFLVADLEKQRNIKRAEVTREVMMVEGLNTDKVVSQGKSKLAQMWTSLLFGDYTSYYLAMAYDVDPTPIIPIDSLKAAMKE
jgi:glucose/mannose-6-phosphate isomerase